MFSQQKLQIKCLIKEEKGLYTIILNKIVMEKSLLIAEVAQLEVSMNIQLAKCDMLWLSPIWARLLKIASVCAIVACLEATQDTRQLNTRDIYPFYSI